MIRPFDSAAPACIPWRYRRPVAPGIVEWGDVSGCAVALPAHVHDEDQVTVVLAGRRRFRVGGSVLALRPGEGLALPAGLPHASLDEPDGVVCRNAYLPAGRYALIDLVHALSGLWDRHGRVDGGIDAYLDGPAFAALLELHRQHTPSTGPASPAPHLGASVAEAAARAGLSREGFSRAFRRTHGIPPSAFAAAVRLNAARRLLRGGVPPAAAAAEAGFADQSHLGRRFRRAFGVTPGCYRAGWEASHPCQTGRPPNV